MRRMKFLWFWQNMWYNCGGIGRERGGALNKRMRAELLDWGKILAGLFLSAMAYRLFLIPNQVAPGGFTGVGQILHELFGWNIGFVVLALNVPLFALSLKSIGWRFGAKSLLASFAFSMLVDYLPVGALTDDALLAAVFGGAIGGAGFGLIMLGGATTGGSDMLGMLIHKRLKVIKVSAAVFMVDGLVILAAGIVYDVRGAMLALIATFIMARVLDRVLEGPSMAKAYFIISTKSEEIAGAVLSQMDRGVTSLSARGMFTGEERPVLLCVINWRETLRLRTLVSGIDPNAFMVATDVREALGEGFQPH
jgi:uncharacterized membrane-anchored protein YitT (DUF2179 family)